MIFEIPFIIAVEAESRDEAENEAADIADSIEATDWCDRIRSCTAVVTRDHNVLDMLRIDVGGTEGE